ncbi:MAG: hypothetical protein QOE61_1974 [Micromonosporaceae bacterium]|nr:hypothetical protein [Micromonosporaceae bacterium]
MAQGMPTGTAGGWTLSTSGSPGASLRLTREKNRARPSRFK